jgi:hypothetical protein
MNSTVQESGKISETNKDPRGVRAFGDLVHGVGLPHAMALSFITSRWSSAGA